jgi:hypothetical protein
MGAKGPVEPDSLVNSTQRKAPPKSEGSRNGDPRAPDSEMVYRVPRRKSCAAAAPYRRGVIEVLGRRVSPCWVLENGFRRRHPLELIRGMQRLSDLTNGKTLAFHFSPLCRS